ncbi:MAG: hypothetical protein EXR72_18110 [Myxococcales bacterium]|nr:hypothetical protein [Myxococcales bacterium]
MADEYIDKDEPQIYGPHAARKILHVLGGMEAIYHPLARHLAAQICLETAAVKVAVDGSRMVKTTLRQGVVTKVPAMMAGRTVLRRFSKHLDGHAEGAIDRTQFFGDGGKYANIGRSAPKILTALQHIAGALKKKGSGVADAAGWQAQIEQAAGDLEPGLTQTQDAQIERSQMTPAVVRARERWLQVYGAAKLIVEGVLRLHGKTDLLPKIFYDLAVPSGARVTEAPKDEITQGAPT